MKSNVELKMMKISDLNPVEYNPQEMSKKEFHQLRESIREFGFSEAITVNRRNHEDFKDMPKNGIVGGFHRVKAGSMEGYMEVPTLLIDVSMGIERPLNLALNKIGGSPNKQKLAELLFMMEDRQIRIAGYSDTEVIKIKETYGPGIEEDEPEFKFTTELLEAHNYVVFVFDNELDWNVVKDKLKINAVHALDSREGYVRKGIGRVLDGKKLLELLNENSDD